jgi:hypothetical protein
MDMLYDVLYTCKCIQSSVPQLCDGGVVAGECAATYLHHHIYQKAHGHRQERKAAVIFGYTLYSKMRYFCPMFSSSCLEMLLKECAYEKILVTIPPFFT